MLKISKNKTFNLFIYGNLQNENESHTNWSFGELRHRHSRDVMAKFGPEYKTRVYGQVKKLTSLQLKHLDKIEAPEYKRQVIILNNGEKAFTYAYDKNDFLQHELIPDGKYFERL